MSDSSNDKERSFLRDALGYLPAMLAMPLIAIIGTVVFTRIFEPEAYGVYSLILSTLALATPLFSQWVGQSVTRFFAEYRRAGKVDDLLDATRLAGLIIVTAVALSATLLYLMFVAGGRSLLDPLVFFGAVALLLAQCMNAILLGMLSAEFSVGRYRSVLVGIAALSVPFGVVLIALLGDNVAWILWGQALAQFIFMAIMSRWTGLLGRVRWRAIYTTAVPHVQRFWRFGGPMALWLLATGVLSLEDRYVIQYFRGTAEQAVYSVNHNLIYGIAAVANTSIGIASGPILFRQWAERQFAKVEATILRMTNYYVVVAVALVGGTIVVGRHFVRLVLAAEYFDGWRILTPVVIGLVLWGSAGIGRKGLELHNKTMVLARLGVITALVNLGLNVLLVPRWGYLAAAYTSVATYGLYVLLLRRATAAFVPWVVSWRWLLTCVAFGAAATAIGLGVLAMMPAAHASLYLLVGGVVFVAAYGGLLFGLARRQLLTVAGVGSA